MYHSVGFTKPRLLSPWRHFADFGPAREIDRVTTCRRGDCASRGAPIQLHRPRPSNRRGRGVHVVIGNPIRPCHQQRRRHSCRLLFLSLADQVPHALGDGSWRMDAFITRKRKDRPMDEPMNQATSDVNSDDEPTEVKLAILSSLHPTFSQEALLDVLLAHEGSVEDSSAALSALSQGGSSKPTKKPGAANIGSQTSLRSFARPFDDGTSSPKKSRLLSRKGATLHLFDPVDIAEHTPCSIIHNFLPSELANDLLSEMLEESKTFEKATFKLFDTVVSSPHTSSFYVDSYDEMQRQKFEYLYNGARLNDVRQITAQLNKAKPIVQEAVNREIQKRIKSCYPNHQKLKYQSPPPWVPNTAFCNSYHGPAESVGWHTDQLTYLGPRAVIGSLSLGVAREFRVRRIVPKDDDNNSTADVNAEGQIAIHLPHNSLLVMHAEMQEEWKHSIAPAQAIDPHPVAGNRRINITYRDYKSYLHPKLTPQCKCGVPTVLRVVQKKKENWGRYFWSCHTNYVPESDGCSFFQWAEFDDDGRPIWDKKTLHFNQMP